MPGYLEAYRRARAQPEEQPCSAAQESTENEQNIDPLSPEEDRKLEKSNGNGRDASKAGAKSNVHEASKTLPSRSFEAAKLRLDIDHGNKKTKESKGKIQRWSTGIEPASCDVQKESPVVESADEPPITSKPAAPTQSHRPGISAMVTPTPNIKAQASAQDKELRVANAPKRIFSDEHWLKDRNVMNATAKPASPLTGLPSFRETSFLARTSGDRPNAWVRRKSTPGKRVSAGEKRQVAFENVINKVSDNDDKDVESTTPLRAGSEAKKRVSPATPERSPALRKEIQETAEGPESLAEDREHNNVLRSAPAKFNRSDERTIPWAAEPDSTLRKGAWIRKRAPKPASLSGDNSTDPEEERAEGASNAPPRPLLTRLSAWLSQTPDPNIEDVQDPYTVDSRPVSVVESGSTIGPRKTSVSRRRRSSHRIAEEKGFDGANSPLGSDSDQSTESNPALKRSGARRRAKGRREREKVDQPLVHDLELAFPHPRKLETSQKATLQVDDAENPGKNRRPDHRANRKRPSAGHNLSSHADLITALSQPQGVRGLVSARTIRTSRKQIGRGSLVDLMNELKSDEIKYIRDLQTLMDGVIPVMLNSILSQTNLTALGVRAGDRSSRDKAKETIVGLGIAVERLHSAHKRLPTNDMEDFIAWAQRSVSAYQSYIAAWKLGFHDVVINLAPAESTKGIIDNRARGDGERVDVAFLLKRPLVRLRYLAKTMKGIHHAQSGEDIASLEAQYQDLTEQSRLKQEKELARLEDEAASSIDGTKVRDPETLAALPGVKLNKHRCVRARDVFDMKMRHSSGQRLDCQVMLFLRDDLSGYANRGDVLVAEVDSSSRWLLFPPAELPQLSARLGKSKRELIVMLRGSSSVGQEWRELMSLTAESAATASEWVKMFGSNPLPPANIESKGFNDACAKLRNRGNALVLANANQKDLDLDVPFGEQSVISVSGEESVESPDGICGDLALSPGPNKRNRAAQVPSSTYDRVDSQFSNRHVPGETYGHPSSGPSSPQHPEFRKAERQVSSKVRDWLSGAVQAPPNQRQIWKQEPATQSNDYTDMDVLRKIRSQRQGLPTRLSTVPSESVPSVQRSHAVPLSNRRQSALQANEAGIPPDFETTAASFRGLSTPTFSPKSQYSKPRRRSSSPLKHEYEPSSDSEFSSVLGELPSNDQDSVTSESSIEDMVPDPKVPVLATRPGPLRSSFAERYTPKRQNNPYPPNSLNTSKAPDGPWPDREQQVAGDKPVDTIKVIASIHMWSDKGMWKLLHPDECSIVVSPGLIEAFEMSAAHSAPKNSRTGSSSGKESMGAIRPLVALELTPLVPLRQSTAIDITIRSPLTANSQLRASNNIMFRTRTGQECEYLYNLINQARINNPTYVALQNARGPAGGSNWATYMDQQASKRGGSSWWRLGSKKSSYRASQTRRSASLIETVSSVNSMSSAISALKKLANGSNLFNVGKSTLSSRDALSNDKSNASFGSSSESSTPAILDPSQGSPTGLTDMKIRLYERETASKWRDMGSARLTIMHPPRNDKTFISPTGHLKQEKRVLIMGKTHGETLLDVTLEETSFERVARTGVAVKIWEQFDTMAKTGGVAGARIRVYMLQMKSEAEAAYTFSLVGRLRY